MHLDWLFSALLDNGLLETLRRLRDLVVLDDDTTDPTVQKSLAANDGENLGQFSPARDPLGRKRLGGGIQHVQLEMVHGLVVRARLGELVQGQGTSDDLGKQVSSDVWRHVRWLK